MYNIQSRFHLLAVFMQHIVHVLTKILRML